MVVTFNFKRMRFVQPNVFLNTHAHDTMLLPQGRQLLQIFYFTEFKTPSHQTFAIIHMCKKKDVGTVRQTTLTNSLEHCLLFTSPRMILSSVSLLRWSNLCRNEGRKFFDSTCYGTHSHYHWQVLPPEKRSTLKKTPWRLVIQNVCV